MPAPVVCDTGSPVYEGRCRARRHNYLNIHINQEAHSGSLYYFRESVSLLCAIPLCRRQRRFWYINKRIADKNRCSVSDTPINLLPIYLDIMLP